MAAKRTNRRPSYMVNYFLRLPNLKKDRMLASAGKRSAVVTEY